MITLPILSFPAFKPMLLFFPSLFFFSSLLASCPTGWIESPQSGTCVKLYDVKKSWEEARAVCREDEADLVKIVDHSMNELIWGKDLFVP